MSGTATVAPTAGIAVPESLMRNPMVSVMTRAMRPARSVGALSADLPALRRGELSAALLEAAGHETSFVRDAAGDGTTLLLARDGVAFEPQFGAGSARPHALAGAHELGGDLPSLRRDVDTPADLAAARGLGLGERTRWVLTRHGL